MNYSESQEIKQKIDSSQKILVNMHHNADADSAGSAIAMARVLKYWSKEVQIISPTQLPKNLHFLLGEDEVSVVNFAEFNFSNWDLLITLDSSSWSRVSGNSADDKPQIPTINIDHHKSNHKFGDINLIVPDAAANCELLFFLLQDLGVTPDVDRDYPDIHTPLLTGIIGDTGAFRFPEANPKTLEVATDLMKLANKDKIIFNLYQSFNEGHVLVWKEIMNNIQLDHEHRFVYSFIRKDVLEANGMPFNAKSELADMIFQSIENTDFGLVGAEDDGYISVSFRSRTGVDVSILADGLGGGGHAWASAARIDTKNTSYDEAIQTVLQKSRDFAAQNKKASNQ